MYPTIPHMIVACLSCKYAANGARRTCRKRRVCSLSSAKIVIKNENIARRCRFFAKCLKINGFLICRLSACKRWPFSMRKTAFGNAKGCLSQNRWAKAKSATSAYGVADFRCLSEKREYLLICSGSIWPGRTSLFHSCQVFWSAAPAMLLCRRYALLY